MITLLGGDDNNGVSLVCEAAPDDDEALVILPDFVSRDENSHVLHLVRVPHVTNVHQLLFP